MLKKLRTKFICFTMVLVFVLLTVIFGMVYGFTARKLHADSLQQMHAAAGRPDMPDSKRPTVPVPYLVLQQNEEGLWVARGSDYYDLTDQAFLEELLRDVSGEEARDGILKEHDLRYLRIDKPELRYVFMDITAERTTLNGLIRTCVMIDILSLGLFMFFRCSLPVWLSALWKQHGTSRSSSSPMSPTS